MKKIASATRAKNEDIEAEHSGLLFVGLSAPICGRANGPPILTTAGYGLYLVAAAKTGRFTSSDPPLQLALHNVRKSPSCRPLAGHWRQGIRGEILAARMTEIFGVLARDLLQASPGNPP